VLVDSTITTLAAAVAAGTAYLAQYASTARGRFGVSDTIILQSHVFHSYARIIDARVGLASQDFAISSYARTFNPSGRENIVISFGGDPPSVTALTRQL